MSVVILGHFLMARMVPSSFVENGPKLSVLIIVNGQFQPHQSMFSIRQRCLIGSLIWGYILTKVKVQNLFRTSALKYRPNCCQHFFSVNISILTTSKNFKLASAKGRGTSVKAQHQVLGKGSTEKKTFSFGHCPNYLTPVFFSLTPSLRRSWEFL